MNKNNKMLLDDSFKKKLKNNFVYPSITANIELILGQPLDRWKVNNQAPSGYKIPFTKFIKKPIKFYYSGLSSTILNRSIIYIPLIYTSRNYANNIYENTQNNFIKNNESLFKTTVITTFISPSLSILENIKTYQQINYKSKLIKNTIVNFTDNNCKISSETSFVSKYMKLLKPKTLTATFLREWCFCYGLFELNKHIYNILDKQLYNYSSIFNNFENDSLSNNTLSNNTSSNIKLVIFSNIFAGIISQTISQPFDNIKTNQEIRNINFIESAKTIYKYQGRIKGFWYGNLPRAIRGIWTFICFGVCTDLFNRYG